MTIIRNSEIEPIQGNEGTSIKQFFHPHNTLERIGYSLAQFTLEPEKKSKLHKMKSSEIYYILEGKANLRINDNTMELEKDDSAYVPPNAKQSIENIGDGNLRFLCIVEPAWKAEDEIILE
ncbi:Mannose-1-phosphate guanylyltransferase 2 protein [Marine Group I thaumarchaeote SCGC AAA799-P11]|uniref:Mannose-1-phosphate guanylyltransferase 2 protein n=1 Tax=Marine Group I thaumarchaeote SCGC AAA799-P11 TaxID=1502295 RepID=A0A087S1A3_9ARCH|nr:Mannose-1-phosphate guanylyltransferase 2 protein [Marine Group I thaumarchaeote SCGC AAA799-P11]